MQVWSSGNEDFWSTSSPNAFADMTGLNSHGSHVLKPGKIKEELQLLRAQEERKTLFDTWDTGSITKFTRNNVCIHHISLTNASSENQKCPYGAFTPSDHTHSQTAWPSSVQETLLHAEDSRALQGLQDYTEIRTSLELIETRSLCQMRLKTTSCHGWQKCRNIYPIFCSISWLGHLHSCPQWKRSTLPLKHTALLSTHETEGEGKTMLLLPRRGRVTT